MAEIANISEIAMIAKIAETEKVRFLQKFKKWVFFDGFFAEKLEFHSNS